MATIPPGTEVRLPLSERETLRFPPFGTGALHVAVHQDALKGAANQLTQVTEISEGEVTWTGAIDERMLETLSGRRADARARLGAQLLRGRRLWSVVRPGLLTTEDTAAPYFTIYHGRRPWVIVGELGNGHLLAMPLNDAHGNPKWYAPRILECDLTFSGNCKNSQLEMAHLWALPSPSCTVVGSVGAAPRAELTSCIARYFGVHA